jgi:hypothetical protein
MPWPMTNLGEGSFDECQNGPTAHHTQDIDSDSEKSDRLGDVPGQETDRHDTCVLGGKDGDCQQKSQEDKGLYVSHWGSPLPKRLVVDDAV